MHGHVRFHEIKRENDETTSRLRSSFASFSSKGRGGSSAGGNNGKKF